MNTYSSLVTVFVLVFCGDHTPLYVVFKYILVTVLTGDCRRLLTLVHTHMLTRHQTSEYSLCTSFCFV